MVKRGIIINQLDLMDIYRTLHPIAAESTYFSISHGTFAKTDHILHHKTHLVEFKRINMHTVCPQTTVELNQKLMTERELKSQNI